MKKQKNLSIILYIASFLSFFLSQSTMFYGFSIIMFGMIFLLNKKIDETVFNSHLEYILTNILIFVVVSILTGGFVFYFLTAYFLYKFWIGINKAFAEESISFEYF